MAPRSLYKYSRERERMSELSGFFYNKSHQKSRETTREIWRSEGEFWNRLARQFNLIVLI